LSELLRNTYTLATAIVLVCSLGSFGGVSLYIIQRGFADQREIMARLNQVEDRTLKSEIQITRLEKDLGL
jgi:3-hydroxyisobutyrate dehydrogenase-like beta-hydroxyacid dehydrogenase